MQFLRDLWSSRELLGNLVLRETRGQYKRTMLGRLWSLFNPLAQMLIFTFIFSLVFRIKPEVGDPSGLDIFPLWLMCGLLPWGFFAASLNATTQSLLSNAGLITKVYFPRTVLPLAAVGMVGTNWLFEMAVLLIALILFGSMVWIWLPGVALMMVLLALFASGIGFLLSIMNMYFRDTQYLLTILLQLWMYLSPIIYPAYLIREMSQGFTEKYGKLLGTDLTIFDVYTWNPMYHFVTAFRQLLYDNRWPDTVHLITCAVWTLVVLLIGIRVFQRSEKKIAELL